MIILYTRLFIIIAYIIDGQFSFRLLAMSEIYEKGTWKIYCLLRYCFQSNFSNFCAIQIYYLKICFITMRIG